MFMMLCGLMIVFVGSILMVREFFVRVVMFLLNLFSIKILFVVLGKIDWMCRIFFVIVEVVISVNVVVFVVICFSLNIYCFFI